VVASLELQRTQARLVDELLSDLQTSLDDYDEDGKLIHDDPPF
jgi:hypothetical protein